MPGRSPPPPPSSPPSVGHTPPHGSPAVRDLPGEATPALTMPLGVLQAAGFEAWARISVQLFRRSIAERARILHEAHLDETWRDFDVHWSGILLEDARSGRMERIDRYAAMCAEELAKRGPGVATVAGPLERFGGGGRRHRRVTMRLPSPRNVPAEATTTQPHQEDESPPSYTPPYPRKAPGDVV